jgi:hypothetical protein
LQTRYPTGIASARKAISHAVSNEKTLIRRAWSINTHNVPSGSFAPF